MPQNNRIRRLLDLLPGDLSQDKLDRLSREFDALAQDSAEVLPFFVMHHGCRRLSDAMDGEAVTISRFHELTAGITEQITSILETLEQGKYGDAGLEKLVATMFQNVALFRA
jgi:hypothetical protein